MLNPACGMNAATLPPPADLTWSVCGNLVGQGPARNACPVMPACPSRRTGRGGRVYPLPDRLSAELFVCGGLCVSAVSGQEEHCTKVLIDNVKQVLFYVHFMSIV